MTVTTDYVEECLRRLEEADVVGLDVETSGLDVHRCFIVGYVLTFGTEDADTYYLPVRHKGGGNIPGCRTPESEHDWSPKDEHPLETRLRTIMRAKPRTWFAHKGKFDLHMLARHDLFIYGDIEDTSVSAALLDENQGKYTLDFCAQVMGVTPKVTAIYEHIAAFMALEGVKIPQPYTQRNTMGHFWKLPAPGMATEYARGDGITMAQLRDIHLVKLAEEDLIQVWEIEKRVTRTLFRMEYRGVPVDTKVLAQVQKNIVVELEKAKKKLPEGFNVRSPAQVQKLYEGMGFTKAQFQMTPAGNPSFVETWLENQPMGPEILAIRKLRNLDSTFIQGAILRHLHNGKVHPTFNQMKADEFGTVSGRLSASDPNFQQIPKRDKVLAPLLRQIFRLDPNFGWWSSDYSQQEYRVFADYAGAKMVLEAYERDPSTDYHQLVADMLSVERDPAAKRINLGTIYNMGAPTLAGNLGCTVSEAKGYLNRMRRMMPEAQQFNKTAQKVAQQKGFVRTLLKRRRRFPGGLHAHKAGNGVIQGSSADITKLKMAETDELLMGNAMEFDPRRSKHKSQLILQVHDSLDFLYVEEERPVMEECMRIMEAFGPDDVIPLQVPMKVDVSTGVSWGHATFGDKYKNWVEKLAA